MLVEQFSTVLPLYRIFSQYESSNFKVQSHWCILFAKIHYRSQDFLKNELNSIGICEADWSDRRDSKLLHSVIEQRIYLRTIKFAKSTYCFLCILIDWDIPVWSCQKIFIQNDKYGV